jgi:transcriptional regulator with XRE-family HTH domain
MAKEGMTLSEYLARENVKRSHFAQSIGVEASTVTRWISGDRTPSLALMERISRATDGKVTPSDFLPADASSPVCANSGSSV